ncbi:hypothetical protein D8T63_15940 [Vibrio vulnificus]|uniref:hypothetical protein n=1 Tax=Vibrio vulnificus TaxID=672 RepID=UPI001029A8A9|nr:hypothetical protein [Vibrio vulnificus]RZR24228.1 hypothetical protein D8T63_15940 [Vibrio vulnificus]
MNIIHTTITLENGGIVAYNDQSKDLTYQGNTLTFGATNACKIFETILYNDRKFTSKKFINDMFVGDDETRAATEIGKLRKMIRNRLKLTTQVIVATRGRGYRINGNIAFETITDDLTEHYKQVQMYEQIGYDNIASLINALVVTYPSLGKFFYQTEAGQYLPFFKMPVTPSFPITIDNNLPSELPLRDDPIYTQRRSIGKKIYPGLIFRLTQASADTGWHLARTNYTHLIESCDYLQARIFGGWGKIIAQDNPDKELQKDNFLKRSPYIKEWLSRIDQILNGDFTHYLAGVAFNTPIFCIEPAGSIKLLLAEGSALKQASGGKYHVCPAGMLEFSKADKEATELSLATFQTYAAKECLEETMRYIVTNDIERIIKTFDNSADREEGDIFSAQTIRYMIEHDLLKNLPADVSPTILQKCLSLDPTKQPVFAICDAFVLRPEIIMPLYIDERPEVVTNWENEKITELTISNPQGITNLANDLHKWAAPGIAAAYLGAKHWFETKEGANKFQMSKHRDTTYHNLQHPRTSN